MCAAPLLDVRPGERVLDLCSAPGGKGTQLAQKMQGQGILVLNEKIPDRARILLQNVERMGVANAVVTCADPEALAQRFAGYFDKILVDAPCSGEGMLRKEAAAAENWERAERGNVRRAPEKDPCLRGENAGRGRKARLFHLHFSEDEDERNAEWLLHEFPFLKLKKAARSIPTESGARAFCGALFPGRGGTRPPAPCCRRGGKAPADALEGFFRRVFKANSAREADLFRERAVPRSRGALFAGRTEGIARRASVGRGRRGRFEPAHALALGAPRDALARKAELSEEEVQRYLRGEELPSKGGKGWCAVCYNGYPLGLAKDGVALKNHYPKGLRIK